MPLILIYKGKNVSPRWDSNTFWSSDFFCVLLWLILYISLYFLYKLISVAYVGWLEAP